METSLYLVSNVIRIYAISIFLEPVDTILAT